MKLLIMKGVGYVLWHISGNWVGAAYLNVYRNVLDK